MLKYLNNKLIFVETQNIEKMVLIEKMVDLINDNTNLVEDRNEFLNRIVQRENIGTTAIGRGIAIPHARTETLKDIALSIAIVPTGIDFNSPDAEKATVIVMIGAPKSKNDEYLSLLSAITRAFRDRVLRESVLRASSDGEIIEILADYFQKE